LTFDFWVVVGFVEKAGDNVAGFVMSATGGKPARCLGKQRAKAEDEKGEEDLAGNLIVLSKKFL